MFAGDNKTGTIVCEGDVFSIKSNGDIRASGIERIELRQSVESDAGFLYSVYASTRLDELAITGWSAQQIEDFLQMQFQLQHKQYHANYKNPSFDIVLVDAVPVGRLFVDRRPEDIRVIDIALLPGFRRQGIGTRLMDSLVKEADLTGRSMSLHVEYDNPIIPFYERLNFRKTGTPGVYLFMKRLPSPKK